MVISACSVLQCSVLTAVLDIWVCALCKCKVVPPGITLEHKIGHATHVPTHKQYQDVCIGGLASAERDCYLVCVTGAATSIWEPASRQHRRCPEQWDARAGGGWCQPTPCLIWQPLGPLCPDRSSASPGQSLTAYSLLLWSSKQGNVH